MRWLFCLLACFLCFLAGPRRTPADMLKGAAVPAQVSAFRQSMQNASLKVNVRDIETKEPVCGGKIGLYQITVLEAGSDGSLSASFSPGLQGLIRDGRLQTGENSKGSSFLPEEAEQADPSELKDCLDRHGIDPQQSRANTSGSVTFSGLQAGLFLVVQADRIPGYRGIEPFLVNVPQPLPVEGKSGSYDQRDWSIFRDRRNIRSGSWNFDVVCTPKIVREKIRLAFHASKILRTTAEGAPDMRFKLMLESMTAGAPMPEDAADGRAVREIRAGQTVTFGTVQFTGTQASEDTYRYCLYEENTGLEGISYDPAVYLTDVKVQHDGEGNLRLSVTISRAADRSSLNTAVTIWKGVLTDQSIVNEVPAGSGTAGLPEFVNTWAPPGSPPGIPGDTPPGNPARRIGTSPQTGDTFSAAENLAVFCAGLLICLILVYFRRKSSRKEFCKNDGRLGGEGRKHEKKA